MLSTVWCLFKRSGDYNLRLFRIFADQMAAEVYTSNWHPLEYTIERWEVHE